MTNCVNKICLYHQGTQKAGGVINGEGKYLLNGVPYKHVATRTKKDNARVQDGYMHCGCSEDVALANFYIWKTWKLTCLETGKAMTELLRDQRLAPCERAFVAAFFEDISGLTMIFTVEKG